MKMIRSIISLTLAAVMLLGMTCVASAAEPDLAPSGLSIESCADGVATVVHFDNGSEYTADGAVNLTATEKNPIIETINNLEVVCDNEVILTVEPKDIAAVGATSPASNGYYMVDFMIPDSEKECFISGMTARKAETIQNEIITAWAESTEFSLVDVDFIDAEKRGNDSGDSQQCWAATISNMLHFTGWGEQAGFHSEDDLFDIFPEYFIDEGYYEEAGIRWFFDGTNSTATSTKDHIRDYPNTGRYLSDYDVSNLCSEIQLKESNYVNGMKRLKKDLRAGNAIGLALNTSVLGAHAITCWGLVTDNSQSEDEASHYVAMIVADSDNDFGYDKDDRRKAPNTLHMAPITEFVDEEGLYYNYPTKVYRAYCGALRDFTTLAPYSPDLPRETDPQATKNRTSTIDLIVKNASVANSADQRDFSSDTVGKGNVTLFFDVLNYSDLDFIDNSDVHVILYKDGVKLMDVSKICFIKGAAYYESRCNIEAGDLDVGSYTAEITINPEKTISEAYYMNNTMRYEFTVVQPEYDVSQMSLSVELDSQLSSGRQYGKVSYDGIPEELLRAAEKVDLQVAQFADGETEYYSTLREDKMSEINPLLPVEISCNKTGKNARFRLTLLCRGIVYAIYSPAYPVEYLNIGINLTGNDTSPKSPVPYGGTKLNDGEQMAFTLENSSWNWDSDITGTYTLISVDQERNVTRLSEPVAFSLQKDEITPEITISSWDVPLTKTCNLNLLFEGESGGKPFEIDNYICTVKVIEKKSTMVTLGSDYSDEHDGMISLREAVAYAKELGESQITLSENVSDLELDSEILIDSTVILNADQSRKISFYSGRLTRLMRVVQGGDLTLSGMFITGENKDGSDGASIICEGGSVKLLDCRFEYCKTNGKGCILYADGGTVIMKNCSVLGSDAQDGTVAYITGGAKVEMLNSLFDSVVTSNALIHNVDGTLNLINSVVVSCYTFDGIKTAIMSDEGALTNVVNSILVENRGDYDADGTVKLYATAYNHISESVDADAYCKAYQTEELFKMSSYLNPVIKFDDYTLHILPMLKSPAAEGCLVTEREGVLYIGKDADSMSSIGVNTMFTADELKFDMVGNTRQTVYGSYSRYEGQPILGDADGDGEVTILDATLIRRYNVLMTELSQAALKAADVDRDGEVCIIDATWIQRYKAQMNVPDGIGQPF